MILFLISNIYAINMKYCIFSNDNMPLHRGKLVPEDYRDITWKIVVNNIYWRVIVYSNLNTLHQSYLRLLKKSKNNNITIKLHIFQSISENINKIINKNLCCWYEKNIYLCKPFLYNLNSTNHIYFDISSITMVFES